MKLWQSMNTSGTERRVAQPLQAAQPASHASQDFLLIFISITVYGRAPAPEMTKLLGYLKSAADIFFYFAVVSEKKQIQTLS